MNATLYRLETDAIDDLLPFIEAYYEFEGLTFDRKRTAAALRQLTSEPNLGQLFLIGVDSVKVGYLMLAYGFSLEFGGRDAFLDEMFIVEKYRGRGLGRQALGAAIEEILKEDIRAVHLEVGRGNKRAQKLYSSLGFESRPRFHLMSKRLKTGCV